MTQMHEGGCRCGAIRFACRGEPKFVARCHCESCRRATGGAFSTWVGWGESQVALSGEAPAVYRSSPGVEREFCAACGTSLAYRGEKWPGETHFLIGTYDDPEAFTPRSDAFAEEALSWAKPKG